MLIPGRRLAAMLMGAALLTSVSTAAVSAQDPSGSPSAPQTCGVLTADEVSAALGATLTVTQGGDTECEFDTDYSAGTFLSLYTSQQSGDLDSIRTLMCSGFGESPAPTVAPDCAIDVQVGDLAGIYLPSAMGTMLYLAQSPDVLFDLQLIGDPEAGIDKQAALSGLATLAAPRLAALPLPTAEPPFAQPSLTADKDLEALFPTDIGGQSVTIQSMSGSDVASNGSVPEELTQALAAQGKTLDDVSIAYGYYVDSSSPNGSGIMTAFQVKGIDMNGLSSVLIPLVLNGETPASQVQTQISGKDVTVVKATAETTDADATYLYPKNDILWVVQAVDPSLTEIFSKLP